MHTQIQIVDTIQHPNWSQTYGTAILTVYSDNFAHDETIYAWILCVTLKCWWTMINNMMRANSIKFTHTDCGDQNEKKYTKYLHKKYINK